MYRFKKEKEKFSSPIIVKDVVYFGCSDQNLYALDLNTGKKLFKYSLPGRVLGTPVFYKDTLIINLADRTLNVLN